MQRKFANDKNLSKSLISVDVSYDMTCLQLRQTRQPDLLMFILMSDQLSSADNVLQSPCAQGTYFLPTPLTETAYDERDDY
jgi:hypothetical protein